MEWRKNCLCPLCLLAALSTAHAQEEQPFWLASPPPVTATFNSDLEKATEEWRKLTEVFIPSSLQPSDGSIDPGGQVELRLTGAQAMVFYRYGF